MYAAAVPFALHNVVGDGGESVFECTNDSAFFRGKELLTTEQHFHA